MKVILDTNTYISYMLNKSGPPAHIVQLWLDDCFSIIACSQLIREIKLVAQRPKFDGRIMADIIDALCRNLEAAPDFTTASLPQIKRSRDHKDDYLLGLADHARADFLVTGDKDLLVLQNHGPTRILTARQFLETADL